MIKTSKGWRIALPVVFLSGMSSMVFAEQAITLEKIMSDPTWIADTPLNAKWHVDGEHVVFEQKVQGSALNDLMVLQPSTKAVSTVEVTERHLYDVKSLTHNPRTGLSAYEFSGDIFVYDSKNKTTTQITRTSAKENNPSFLLNDNLVYWVGNVAYEVNLSSYKTKELMALKMAKAPSAPEKPSDIIAKEQHDLIDYVANKQKDDEEKWTFKQNVRQKNQSIQNRIFYFGKGQRLVHASVSPKGDKAFVVTAESKSWRDDGDIMPNYIGMDGRIKAEKVRRRVADATPNQQNFWIVDLQNNSKSALNVSDLPDFDKDVLKKVRQENAKANGERYKSKKEPRTINLLVDWTWSQNAATWSYSGDNLAVMLEAWDNKDRWIATVDFDDSAFKTQHQLHDDAWINYTFNDFGWFHNSEKLYFLSEESGYSHIYTKALNKRKPKKLTSGEFEVSQLTLSKDDEYFYFKANVRHPGDYQIYRVSSDNKGKLEALTDMEGMNDYSLNNDESKLLIIHSSLLSPDDLYLVDIESKTTKRLTDTVSEEFRSMPWTKPEIVEVPSSYQDKPVYARVYYPKDYQQGEKRRAVIFNHGAGYLQNSHKGWSGYFREFMFHSMLAQQGYVVMDMDYRASKGYGRDWRTAIYRQMGTPEIEDLRDGVKWLVSNANVDRNKIGTYGGSYGGFMTFMALFNAPDLFQAGAALRPVSDWAHYNDGYTSNILNRPEDDMIAYRRSSPIYFAEGLQKPLLINAPMVDNNVFFVDVVRLVQRFIELEKQDFETAIYPVEPHGFVQPSSWLDEYRRIYKLFETHL